VDFRQPDMCDITYQTPPPDNAYHHDAIQRRKHEHQDMNTRKRDDEVVNAGTSGAPYFYFLFFSLY
jgi:hypothetical protein